MCRQEGGDTVSVSWFRVLTPRPHAVTRLICFPYAGGGVAPYRQWTLDPRIEVAAVQLPGREDRFHDEPYDAMTPLVDRLVTVLADELDRPFAFFGHSMGARVAFALSHALRDRGLPGPQRLFVSGSPGPCLPIPVGGWNEPDEGLVAWLHRMDGTPQAIMRRPELLAALLPTLRADLTVVATHPYRRRDPLDLPIHAFAGLGDDYATPERMTFWRRETAAAFALDTFAGGHFFLSTALPHVLAMVTEDLLSTAPAVLAGEAR
jgi:surfactin synthase thioesterase subunit